MPHWNVKLANAIQKLRDNNWPVPLWAIALADELAPPEKKAELGEFVVHALEVFRVTGAPTNAGKQIAVVDAAGDELCLWTTSVGPWWPTAGDDVWYPDGGHLQKGVVVEWKAAQGLARIGNRWHYITALRPIDFPPEKKPKPPDGWEFEDYDHPRLPKEGEWYLNGRTVQKACGDHEAATGMPHHILRRIVDPEGWRAKFYPEPACDVPAERALDHGLQKWIGARKESLEMYGLMARGGQVRSWEAGLVLEFDGSTCALCHRFQARSYRCDKEDCSTCPLEIACAGVCRGGGAYGHFSRTGDPEPMIAALEKAIAERDAKNYDAKLIAECKDAAEGMKAHEQEKVAQKVKTPKPGEFAVVALKHGNREIVQILNGPAEQGYLFALRANGTWRHGRTSDYAPWTPKVGEDVFYPDGEGWGRDVVDGTKYDGGSSRVGGVWFFSHQLRPISFPPPKCCATCGAKQ